MKFSEKLIKLRKQKGLSQEDLGNQINVSRQAISKWESEQANPEIEKVKEISKLFNVSIDYLLNDKIVEPRKEVLKVNNKIKKAIISLFLIIIIIYLLIAVYKFSILLKYSIKANKINDYDNCIIMATTVINNRINNNVSEFSENIIHKNNIEVTESYDKDNEAPTDITYINSKERKAYNLNYDFEEGKYVYTNIEDVNEENSDQVYEYTTIKELTKNSIPNSLMEIILSALNPRVKIEFQDDYLFITTKLKNGYNIVQLNKITGILNEFTSDSEYILYQTTYSYVFDTENPDMNYLIEEEYLKDIEYVTAEQVN